MACNPGSGDLVSRARKAEITEVLPLQYSMSLMLCIVILPFEPLTISFDLGFLVPLLWLGLIISVATQLLFYQLIRTGNLVNVTSLFYLVPVVTAALDYLLLGNRLGHSGFRVWVGFWSVCGWCLRSERSQEDHAGPAEGAVDLVDGVDLVEHALIPTILVAGAPITDYESLRLKFRLLVAFGLFVFGGSVYHARGGVVESAHHCDGFLDYVSSLAIPEVPDKYPLELRSTPSVDIVVGHARKDQSGGILVSGLARERAGCCSLGPNMNLEVVVRGPHREVLEQSTIECYLRSPGHGLAAQAHFALYLKSVPPPGSSVEISCRPR